MKYLILAVLFISVSLAAQDLSVQDLLKQGDDAFDAFDNERAMVSYLKAYEADNSNCEALWKITRAYVDLGEELEGDEQKEHYKKADEYADLAITTCPDDADAHLFKSVALGRVALVSGKKEQVQLSATVKEEAMKALELDPNKDVAHHVLARWHRKVANLGRIQRGFAKVLYGGLPDASNEKAIEHFKKAIELNPSFLNHYLELGLTYEETEEWQKAKEQYDKVLELPATSSDDEEHKKAARERLEKISKKLD